MLAYLLRIVESIVALPNENGDIPEEAHYRLWDESPHYWQRLRAIVLCDRKAIGFWRNREMRLRFLRRRPHTCEVYDGCGWSRRCKTRRIADVVADMANHAMRKRGVLTHLFMVRPLQPELGYEVVNDDGDRVEGPFASEDEAFDRADDRNALLRAVGARAKYTFRPVP